MHKSRLSTFVIDCKGTDLDEAARFWSAALGREAKVQPDGDLRYRELRSSPDEPLLLLQSVEHDSRIHLDIEADDLDAEAARLEKLGAKRIGFVKRWWVMEAPTGQRFCIVRPQRGPLGDDANEWP
jgi:predicted enzyme related to lactoylglutathione lyase